MSLGQKETTKIESEETKGKRCNINMVRDLNKTRVQTEARLARAMRDGRDVGRQSFEAARTTSGVGRQDLSDPRLYTSKIGPRRGQVYVELRTKGNPCARGPGDEARDEEARNEGR